MSGALDRAAALFGDAGGLSPRAAWALRSAAALGVGAGLSWGQAPASFWPAILIGVAAAFALFRAAPTPRAAAWTGWLIGVGYFLPGLLWIGSAFLVEADKFAWMRPFAVTILPMGLSLFWALAFAAAARLAPARDVHGLAAAGALTLTWALAEWARGHVLTGFPWGLFAFAWIETPVAQSAAWIGPYALTLLTLGAGLALGVGALALRRGARGPGLGAVAASAALIATLWGVGAARLPAGPAPTAGPVIRLVQPNVPQKEKWAAPFVQRNFNRLLSLSARPAAERPGLVVWPETATPFLVDRRADLRAAIMTRIAAPLLVVGSQRYEGPSRADARWWNSLFVLGAGGRVEAVYDKHHLVPFGEFLPFQETLQAFGIRQLAGRSTGFRAGPGPVRLSVPGAPSFQPLICYEAIFPHEMATGDDRPSMLLQITNDAWFGDSGGPRQHLVQARMRAIEQGLAFLRSANTGVSAAIDPYGRVVAAIPLNRQGILDVRAAAPLPPTLYARWGDAVFWALAALGALGGAVLRFSGRGLAPRGAD